MSDVSLLYKLQFVGVPYKYGGNNFLTGIDCSGLVCEYLKAEGKLSHSEDLTAQQLFHRFKNKNHGTLTRLDKITPDIAPEFGCLVFYGKSINEIVHVGYCLSAKEMIEAGGGDASTDTRAEAEARGAMVRVRPPGYRRDLLGFVKP